jgi:hypothetical protein
MSNAALWPRTTSVLELHYPDVRFFSTKNWFTIFCLSSCLVLKRLFTCTWCHKGNSLWIWFWLKAAFCVRFTLPSFWYLKIKTLLCLFYIQCWISTDKNIFSFIRANSKCNYQIGANRNWYAKFLQCHTTTIETFRFCSIAYTYNTFQPSTGSSSSIK